MCLAALEESSLPSSGVVTPSATSNTNLSLFTQSQRHGESSSRAKGHVPCGPRDKFSTLFRNRNSIKPIDFSNTRSRMGQSSLSPKRIPSTIIDYSSTQFRMGQSSVSPKMILISVRLTFDYYGTRLLDGTSSLYPKRKSSSMIQHLVDYYGTWPLKDKPLIYKDAHETSINRLLR